MKKKSLKKFQLGKTPIAHLSKTHHVKGGVGDRQTNKNLSDCISRCDISFCWC